MESAECSSIIVLAAASRFSEVNMKVRFCSRNMTHSMILVAASAAFLVVSKTLNLAEAFLASPLTIHGRPHLISQPSVCVGMGVDDNTEGGKKKGFFAGFFEELDNFVDDATSRRLGNGAAFYGKRKSSFYGADDKDKKSDSSMPDPTEDYQGPTSSGYFKWMPDEETGRLKPVSKMRERNMERNPKFWDRAYSDDESED